MPTENDKESQLNWPSTQWIVDGAARCEIAGVDQVRDLVDSHRTRDATARLCRSDGCEREAVVTSLSEDGWVVRVRDHSIQRWAWPGSMLVSRWSNPSGDLPPARWLLDRLFYTPGVESASGLNVGGMHVLPTSDDVASVVSSWLSEGRVPAPFDLGGPQFEPIRCDSVVEAIDRVAPDVRWWRPEVRTAVLEFTSAMAAREVFLLNPAHIMIRVADREQPIEIVLHKHPGSAWIIGLRDALGVEFRLEVPSGTELRLSEDNGGTDPGNDPFWWVYAGSVPWLWGHNRAGSPE